jgi:hypothetical protein
LAVPCARRGRTIRMCSLDARGEGPTKPPPWRRSERAWKEQFEWCPFDVRSGEPNQAAPVEGNEQAVGGRVRKLLPHSTCVKVDSFLAKQ